MKLILGIDTGGTYTDSVLYDSENQVVLAKSKSLTTKENLSIGIENSFSRLPIDLIKRSELISLSSTLATNACVEEKGGYAKLILFGMSIEKVMEYGNTLGKYNSEDIICIETDTSFNGIINKMPDWDEFKNIIESECKDCETIAVVEIYSRQTGAYLEKKASEIIKETLNIKTVCGYELFDDLNYLKRGASTLLNAKLIPLIEKFISAVQSVTGKYDLNIPVVMVRSDGSLMSLEYAKLHPIETLLSGPVASTIGACKLAKIKDAVIVDMGGTTSDIAVLKNGKPLKVNGGITIGKWKTFVKGICINTFGLGGDSGIRYSNNELSLETRRMIPICSLAAKYPEILPKLKQISLENKNTQYIHEFLVLQNSPINLKDYSSQEIQLIKALQNKPLSTAEAAETMGVSLYNLNTRNLENRNIIMRSGLTPTDIMHINGDYNRFCTQASKYAADFVAKNLQVTTPKLCDMIYDMVCKKLYLNLAKIFMSKKYTVINDNTFSEVMEKLLHKEWKNQNLNKNDELQLSLKLSVPIVGIGGPIRMFANKVANAFHTNSIIPEHSEVANAVGAAIGQGEIKIKVLVRPYYFKQTSIKYYDVYAKGISKRFNSLEYEKAVCFAEKTAKELAEKEADIRGITNTIKIESNVSEKYFSDTSLLSETAVSVTLKGSMY